MKPAEVALAVLSENQFEIIEILKELEGKCPRYGDTKNIVSGLENLYTGARGWLTGMKQPSETVNIQLHVSLVISPMANPIKKNE